MADQKKVYKKKRSLKKTLELSQGITDQLKSLLSSIAVYYWIKDKKGRYLACNNHVAQALGLLSKDIIGKTDYDFPWSAQASSLLLNDQDVMRLNQPLVREETVIDKENQRRTFLATKAPFRDRSGRLIGTIGTSVDITPIKRAKEQAEIANRVKSEFVANVSHDMRTPLTGLLGVAQGILERSEDPLLREEMLSVVSCANELLQLFNEVIELVQSEFGHAKFKEHVFSLSELVQHNAQLLKLALYGKQLEFKIDIDKTIPDFLYGNRFLLDRVLLNILSNAVKFTHVGFVSLSIRLIEKKGDEVSIEIVIEDTGIGMNPNQVDEIFEPFSRLTASYQGLYKGSGLGLSMVRNYLKIIKGQMDIHTELGRGSKFRLSFSMKIAEASAWPEERQVQSGTQSGNQSSTQPGTQSAETGMMSQRTRSIKLLVVEDHALAAKMAGRILEKLHCVVDVATSGQEALAMIDKNIYDLIYMDLGLPDMDGVVVTERIRRHHDKVKAAIPVVGLTAHLEQQKYQAYILAGMQDILIKPLTPIIAEKTLRAQGF